MMMSISSAFHMPPRGSPAQRVIERMDHAAIFVFIASSFTPAHGICFRGSLRWGPLTLIWTLALAGVALKVLFFEYVPEWLGQIFYVALGWLGIFSGYLLARRHGFNFIKPLVFGGIAYSIGAGIDLFRFPIAVPGVIHSHELFHLTVLMGAFWHWLFVWQIAPGHRTVIDFGAAQPEPIDALA
jgi:channel protein (hemolysin III family)